MTKPPVLLWLRRDLRLGDQPALAAAAASGHPVLPVYVLEDRPNEDRPDPGGAGRWWLHHSLAGLGREIAKRRGRLLLRRSRHAAETMAALARDVNAAAVYWGRDDLAPGGIDVDLRRQLAQAGMAAHLFDTTRLFAPGSIRTGTGGPYKVFTPFWRACRAAPPPPEPEAAPKHISFFLDDTLAGDELDDWHLRPTEPDWAGGLRAAWEPGESPARARLAQFVDAQLKGYAAERDRPDRSGSSLLSPHLHFGEISPRQVWHAVDHAARTRHCDRDGEVFLAELGWREFARELLAVHPDMARQPMRPEYRDFPWRRDRELQRRWREGRTGIPIVDAGMRQLWRTGWMHNRVRMIAASFLVKHLLQPWQDGADWFLDTLVDADLANNSTNWQWVAGCGVDAAPFFRIFNPVTQARKFDPKGDYIRRWVPELAHLDAAAIHEPRAKDYMEPMVDLAEARRRCLDAYAQFKDEPDE